MSEIKKIRAVKGMMVFNPGTKLHLKDDGPGVEVAFSLYWRRRLKAGEIIIVVAEKVSKKMQSKKAKNKKTGDK